MQGCQVKILKRQTMLERGQKKAKPIAEKPEKSLTLFAVLQFFCLGKHLNYTHTKNISFEIKIILLGIVLEH